MKRAAPVAAVKYAPAIMPAGRRAWIVLGALGLLALASLLFACSVGSVSLSVSDLFGAIGEALRGRNSSLAATLLELRMSRALAGFSTGAMLALAGVMMQALLRNPLADPYVLGVSGGAAAGALGAMLFFSAAWMIDVAAFGGALAVALLLLSLAHRDLKSGVVEGNVPLLLLTGVIVASGCGALVTLMLSIAPDNRLRGMVFWLIGDLSGTQLRWLPWLTLGAALIFAVRAARSINLVALHAEAAATLGVSVGPLRRGLFICAALLTASAVSSAGSIGFVGLIVPHACRFALGPDHRLLLPAATLVGGTFLVLADTLARTVVAPQQLPVGVITALIGVPVFLLQLHQMRRR
jgi:iron complex transport system permease protein